jgi:hypothetical protein
VLTDSRRPWIQSPATLKNEERVRVREREREAERENIVFLKLCGYSEITQQEFQYKGEPTDQ